MIEGTKIDCIFYSFFFFAKIPLSKQNSPRWDAAFCVVASKAILLAYVLIKRMAGLYEIIMLPLYMYTK